MTEFWTQTFFSEGCGYKGQEHKTMKEKTCMYVVNCPIKSISWDLKQAKACGEFVWTFKIAMFLYSMVQLYLFCKKLNIWHNSNLIKGRLSVNTEIIVKKECLGLCQSSRVVQNCKSLIKSGGKVQKKICLKVKIQPQHQEKNNVAENQRKWRVLNQQWFQCNGNQAATINMLWLS